MLKDGIETIQGKTNPHILLIAPHGYPDPDNDENTGALVREMQKILDCPAIINEVYRRPKQLKAKPKQYEKSSLKEKILDLNDRTDAEKLPYYIEQIQQSIKEPDSTIVVWIHGIDDRNIKDESKELDLKEKLHCLIGYGQPGHETCNPELKDVLLQTLNAAGIKSAHTRKDALNYRGFEDWNMNRWFKVGEKGLEAVQSIQLELGYAGVRDPNSIEGTAKKLAHALLSLKGSLKAAEKEEDTALVVGSFNLLSGYCNGEHHGAMRHVGDFVIDVFYGRDPQRVIEKKPVLKESLYSLINKLKEGGDKIPSKSWFYNARDLAAYEQVFKNRGFQIFGNLGHSHKLALLPVRDLGKIEALATEATKRDLNVAQLNHRIKEEKNSSRISLDTVLQKANLAKLDRKELTQLRKEAETKIEHHQEKVDHFRKCLEEINSVIEKAGHKGSKDKKPVDKAIEHSREQPPDHGPRKFSGWDKVEMEKQDGTKVEATAPIIISASRATDIPAFYSEWLMNRLRQGYLVKRHPLIRKRLEHISFGKTRLIVFWTKNPEPLFQHLDEIDKMGINYYFQYTLNDYEAEGLEPNLPPLNQRIEALKKLSKRIGPEKVIWRFDPLILSDLITKEILVEKVRGLANHLPGHTKKLVISFLRAAEHRKVVRNLTEKGIKYNDFTAADVNFVASQLGQISKEFGIEVATCADDQDLSFYGISHNKCIDDGLIRRLFNRDERLMDFIGDGKGLKDSGQRKLCGCIVSKDIGEYHTCPHLCLYCYANISEKTVKRNLERIDQTGELLLPPSSRTIAIKIDSKKQGPVKESSKKNASGFQEWAGKTFNICSGCENDCLYCWAKERAYRFKQVVPGKWDEPKIRQHDVDRKHRAYGVRVAFPSTHDIFPSNIDAYLSVLRKLLDAGNEVLIVSKPRFDCIRAVCEEAKNYREKILFRFTIGALDDDILSFWEPNAPKFLERAESLRYAYKQGFRTSISTEPMLQSNAIEAMAEKLLPLVNDTMWIGKMNYLGRLKKKAGETLTARIADIEQGQTDERIWAIYNSLKANPKIKWKDSIKKVVGLEMPTEPGLDI